MSQVLRVVDKVRIIRGGYGARSLMALLNASTLDIEQWMEQHTRLVNGDRHSHVGLFQLGDDYCFLKFYDYQSNVQKILCSVGIGQPLRAFKIASALRKEGVIVPRPRGCLQVPQGLLLLTEGIPCEGNMREVWDTLPHDEERGRLLQVVGQSIAQLHLCGFAHGNCKWSNLLWDGRSVCMVDLDGAGKASVHSVRQARDLARFTLNAEELGIGTQLFDTFLESYIQAMGETRQAVVERMASHLYALRAQHLARYGPHAQRLI